MVLSREWSAEKPFLLTLGRRSNVLELKRIGLEIMTIKKWEIVTSIRTNENSAKKAFVANMEIGND